MSRLVANIYTSENVMTSKSLDFLLDIFNSLEGDLKINKYGFYEPIRSVYSEESKSQILDYYAQNQRPGTLYMKTKSRGGLIIIANYYKYDGQICIGIDTPKDTEKRIVIDIVNRIGTRYAIDFAMVEEITSHLIEWVKVQDEREKRKFWGHNLYALSSSDLFVRAYQYMVLRTSVFLDIDRAVARLGEIANVKKEGDNLIIDMLATYALDSEEYDQAKIHISEILNQEVDIKEMQAQSDKNEWKKYEEE